jgi:hypothetical protein
MSIIFSASSTASLGRLCAGDGDVGSACRLGDALAFVITSRLPAAKKSMEPVTLKLLNELYRELKRDMRSAMIAGFPLTSSLRKRVQHIWNAYVTWGLESPAKRRAMMQLTVSERIT